MSVLPTTRRTQRTALAAISTVVASLAFTGSALASGPTVDYVAGNPKCADVAAGYKAFKFESPRGSMQGSGFTVNVTGKTFTWSAAEGVDVVIVKGGPNANVYRYSPESTGGSGLHAPVNPSNGQFYGLSHIEFCYDTDTPKPPPPPKECEKASDMKADGTPCTPPPPPVECEKASDMKADGTPCTPVKECEQASGMKADGTPCTPPKECEQANGMKADGTPCTPKKQDDPKPVSVTVPSRTSVLGQRGVIGVRAAAAMQAPRRCVSRAFTQVVTGRGIRRVTLSVNGRVVGQMRGTTRRRTMRIDPSRFRGDVLRITARTTFVAGATNRRARTLRVTALRCAQAPTIRFAG